MCIFIQILCPNSSLFVILDIITTIFEFCLYLNPQETFSNNAYTRFKYSVDILFQNSAFNLKNNLVY